jgi:hypothetical protein
VILSRVLLSVSKRLGVEVRLVIKVFLGMHKDVVELIVPLHVAQFLVYTLKYSVGRQVKQEE